MTALFLPPSLLLLSARCFCACGSVAIAMLPHRDRLPLSRTLPPALLCSLAVSKGSSFFLLTASHTQGIYFLRCPWRSSAVACKSRTPRCTKIKFHSSTCCAPLFRFPFMHLVDYLYGCLTLPRPGIGLAPTCAKYRGQTRTLTWEIFCSGIGTLFTPSGVSTGKRVSGASTVLSRSKSRPSSKTLRPLPSSPSLFILLYEGA